jgi:two-component system chemotaxis sensor kinase CheA
MEKNFKYFLIEAAELLADSTRVLLALEKAPGDRGLLKDLFRYLHTLKGAASLVKLPAISGFAHAIEDYLAPFRNPEVVISADNVTRLLDAVTLLGKMVDAVKAGEPEDSVDISAGLAQLQQGAPQSLPASEIVVDTIGIGTKEEAVSSADTEQQTKKVSLETSNDRERNTTDETIRIEASELERLGKLANEILINNSFVKDILSPFVDLARIWNKTDFATSQGGLPKEIYSHDSLRERFEQSIGMLEQRTANTLELARELSDTIQTMHLVAVGQSTYLFEKSVRDLAVETGRQVNLNIEGRDLRLNRALLDRIQGPVYHLLRNSIIHGLEDPAQRREAGKPPAGSISLRFEKEMGRVRIICSDDGRGLDAQQLRESAVAKKIIGPQVAAGLSDEESFYLILRSGFSSAKELSELAGRGIGLDVVQDCISGLGGSISIESEPGKSTNFTMILPLSIDLIKVFAVQVADHRFLIPFRNLVETRLVAEADIDLEAGNPVVRYNGNPIPLIGLAELMALPQASLRPANAKVVLAKGNHETIALVVDEFDGTAEIMPKTLVGRLDDIENILFSTIMPNGDPAFVLDLPEVVVKAKKHKVKADFSNEDIPAPLVLVVDDSLTTRILVEGILSNKGYRVIIAKSGEEALEQIGANEFDLMVTDVEMPGIDGFELTKQVRQIEKVGSLPIIILSSLGSDDEKRRGINAGANAYVVKGEFDQDELLSTVESLIV